MMLSLDEFQKVKGLETAFEIWERLKEIYEGTSNVKSAKLYIYKGQFNDFVMNDNEDVPSMFTRLNNIVNNLKTLGFEVSNQDFSHKFLSCLPDKYETIVTMLIRTDLMKLAPSEVLGEVITNDMFKKSKKNGKGLSIESEKKNIAEVIIAKHRAGSTGTVELAWLGSYTKFANLAKDYQ